VIGDLIGAAQEGSADEELRALLKRLVPDYEPSLAGMPIRHEARPMGRAHSSPEEDA